ncbi:hypothetical protein Dimus_018021, partial [Dionaea muscipula]
MAKPSETKVSQRGSREGLRRAKSANKNHRYFVQSHLSFVHLHTKSRSRSKGKADFQLKQRQSSSDSHHTAARSKAAATNWEQTSSYSHHTARARRSKAAAITKTALLRRRRNGIVVEGEEAMYKSREHDKKINAISGNKENVLLLDSKRSLAQRARRERE